MSLTTRQSSIFNKIRSTSTSQAAERLTDSQLRFLLVRVARDLGVSPDLGWDDFPLQEFFKVLDVPDGQFDAGPPKAMFEELLAVSVEADIYLECLASLYKGRMKYRNILRSQPLPQMDQVGPRGLLQFGTVSEHALFGLLVWRKWLFDVDNRAGQDTGYLFEPVLAGAIGGTPVSAKKSPVKRHNDQSKGRQVDCIKDDKAYEFKMRITIAASGQGRWQEELDFVEDCKTSGYKPVLMVLDPTPNPKLQQLVSVFESNDGVCYLGEEAWQHLRDEASPEMRGFIKNYVEAPLEALFEEEHQSTNLPDFGLRAANNVITFKVGDEEWDVPRTPRPSDTD